LLGVGGPGKAGLFGGNPDATDGGGGGALGGSIFNDGGTVTIENSTFNGNFVTRGLGGGGTADNGADAGAAVFSHNGSLTVVDSTISGNQGTGSGAGVVVEEDGASTSFTLNDTIIANNGAQECFLSGAVTSNGKSNLVMSNGSGGSFSACPDVVSSNDPMLGLLQINTPGLTPTMAIPKTSPALNAADATTSLLKDQRGVDRPQFGGFDIGAYELCVPANPALPPCQVLVNAPPPETDTLTVQVSPAAGGTTSPAAGTHNEPVNSVIVLMAAANPGFFFQNWAGNVAAPTSRSTTVTMNQSQTVTANFGACATDVTPSVTITRGGFSYNFSTGRFVQAVTLKNASGSPIAGSISLVLDNLSSNATLFNKAGVTACDPPLGSPFVVPVVSGSSLVTGASVTVYLQFTDPTKTGITYTTRVLAGAGPQ
jgi:hypothetical protein